MTDDLDSTLYKTLLESTKAIPWMIDWKKQEFVYVGPQIEELLGWTPASWKTTTDWVERMHPDDREYTVNYCIKLSNEGTDHEADYRALKSNGDYVWIRDVVHVIRENGETVQIVGFMFDITERKNMENQLHQLSMEYKQLSMVDELTGLANKRALDNFLKFEFPLAQRHVTPLSVLFIDIDFFKHYNDEYGHVEGDNCLKEIAQLLNASFPRATDLIVRYGGEEFIVVLPDTNTQTAAKLAEQCRLTIENKNIPHKSSPIHNCVTASIGLATVDAIHTDSDFSSLINRADKMLYKAKHSGRNRVEFETE